MVEEEEGERSEKWERIAVVGGEKWILFVIDVD